MYQRFLAKTVQTNSKSRSKSCAPPNSVTSCHVTYCEPEVSAQVIELPTASQHLPIPFSPISQLCSLTLSITHLHSTQSSSISSRKRAFSVTRPLNVHESFAFSLLLSHDTSYSTNQFIFCVTASEYTLHNNMARHENDSDSDEGAGTKGKGKARRELPAGAVATLKAWLLSPEHLPPLSDTTRSNHA